VHESASAAVAAEAAAYAGGPLTVVWASEPRKEDDYEHLATAAVPENWTPQPVDEGGLDHRLHLRDDEAAEGRTGHPPRDARQHARDPRCAPRRCRLALPGRAAPVPRRGAQLFANPVLYAGGTVLVARAFDPAETLVLITPTRPPR